MAGGTGTSIRASRASGLRLARCLLCSIAVGLWAASAAAQDEPRGEAAEESSITLDPLEAQALWDRASTALPLGRVTVQYESPATGCSGYVTSVAYRLAMPRDVTMKLTVHCDGGCAGVDCAPVQGCTPIGLDCTPSSCKDTYCEPWCERTISTPDILGAP